MPSSDSEVFIDCAHIPGNFTCCTSCHTDEEEYGRYLPGGWWLSTPTRNVEVCCGASEFLEGQPDRGESLITAVERRLQGDTNAQ